MVLKLVLFFRLSPLALFRCDIPLNLLSLIPSTALVFLFFEFAELPLEIDPTVSDC